MDSDFQWLRSKVESLHSKQDEMNSILVENTASLKEHMRRTELLEEELKPIKNHVQLMNGAAKLLSLLFSIGIAAHALGLI